MEPQVLSYADWYAAQSAHQVRVEALTDAHLARRAAGRKHPVEDFLWVYYRNRPGQLRRWHPGAGVVLEGTPTAADPGRRTEWFGYRSDPTGRGVVVDARAVLDKHSTLIERVEAIVGGTLDRPAQWGCFGLHEWAMVYRLPQDAVRHEAWPLRLGPAGTDHVVETHQLRCTHHDAFRFFTPEAAPRNAHSPTRERQAAQEQPGCLHATMDLYKWAFQLAPAVSSDTTMAALELARAARELDMRASPYDLRELGYEPIEIESPEGKATYVVRQREIAERGQALRRQLQRELRALRALASAAS